MIIAIALFEQVTALDAVGPYEMLQRLPGAEVVFCGARPGPVRTDRGRLGLMVDAAWHEVPRPAVVVVPGGVGVRALLRDDAALGWLRDAHATSTCTASVCTGSLLLAAAGLLDGLTATTHWSARDELATLGAVPVARRVVEHPQLRLVTAAGVSAGLDMALALAARLSDRVTAEAQQLMLEYDPRPPFDQGTFERARSEVVARALQLDDPRG